MNEIQEKIHGLELEIKNHDAMKALDVFGANLEKRPLSAKEQKIFFATMRDFFKEVPGGILGLALQVNDYWEQHEPYEATHKASYILFADVDELGLQEQHKGILPSHHQLFRDLCAHLNISEQDLSSQENILSEGTLLGKDTSEYYRRKGVAAGLGFHLSSETTSNREFNFFLNGFKAHKKHYGLKSDKDPVLDFFAVHTVVEPLHKANGKIALRTFLTKNPQEFTEVRNGAIAFMDGFEKLFSALNQKIYSV